MLSQAEGQAEQRLGAMSEAGRRAGLGKGSGPHPLLFLLSSPEVTHVVMEGTSAEEAISWQEHRTPSLPPGCSHPALLDVSWFTESMAAGQPVPVERRHRLEVSWVDLRVGPPAGTGDRAAASFR